MHAPYSLLPPSDLGQHGSIPGARSHSFYETAPVSLRHHQQKHHFRFSSHFAAPTLRDGSQPSQAPQISAFHRHHGT
jgi:hypothetical protein